MNIPNLKRVKISSEQELRVWLNKHPNQEQSVMLVTHNKKFLEKHVSREQVQGALIEHGWADGPRYTLNAHLIGHVISKRQDQRSTSAR